METKNQWANTDALANIATGLVLYSLVPFFFGLVKTNVGCIQWAFCAIPFVIIAVIGDLKNGEVVSAVANSILTGMCLLVNLVEAMITLCTANSSLPEEISRAISKGNGMTNLAASVFCFVVVWLAWHVNKAQALAVCLPGIGFFLLFLTVMEIAGPFHMPVAILFTAFGTWMLYSGMAMLIHDATGKEVLPYIVK